MAKPMLFVKFQAHIQQQKLAPLPVLGVESWVNNGVFLAFPVANLSGTQSYQV
jgi:hypothetical protein